MGTASHPTLSVPNGARQLAGVLCNDVQGLRAQAHLLTLSEALSGLGH